MTEKNKTVSDEKIKRIRSYYLIPCATTDKHVCEVFNGSLKSKLIDLEMAIEDLGAEIIKALPKWMIKFWSPK